MRSFRPAVKRTAAQQPRLQQTTRRLECPSIPPQITQRTITRRAPTSEQLHYVARASCIRTPVPSACSAVSVPPVMPVRLPMAASVMSSASSALCARRSIASRASSPSPPCLVFPGGGIFFWWQAGCISALQQVIVLIFSSM